MKDEKIDYNEIYDEVVCDAYEQVTEMHNESATIRFMIIACRYNEYIQALRIWHGISES